MKHDQLITLVFDPGSSGGYAVCFGGLNAITLHNLLSPSDLIDHILELEEIHKGFLRAVLEDVPPYAGKNIPSYTSFKLGRSCGFLEGLLRGRQIPVEFLSPKKWQKPLGGLKGLTGTKRKAVLRDHACRLYPLLKPTLKTCDALLMAHYHFSLTSNQK
jgi:hypothetical protein